MRRVVWQKFTDVSEVLAASIIRAIAYFYFLKLFFNFFLPSQSS
jgi:hypothetical protein